jgi:hypothetical protein
MSHDDSELTPQQRMAQVAAILARGVLRLKQVAVRGPTESDQEVLVTVHGQTAELPNEGA